MAIYRVSGSDASPVEETTFHAKGTREENYAPLLAVRVVRVLSIKLGNTASLRRNGLMKRCGLGKRQPSPASRPIAGSAPESAAPTSSGFHAIGGASGAGTKAV